MNEDTLRLDWLVQTGGCLMLQEGKYSVWFQCDWNHTMLRQVSNWFEDPRQAIDSARSRLGFVHHEHSRLGSGNGHG